MHERDESLGHIAHTLNRKTLGVHSKMVQMGLLSGRGRTTKFTLQEEKNLCELLDKSASMDEICRALDRRESSIRAKIKQIALKSSESSNGASPIVSQPKKRVGRPIKATALRDEEFTGEFEAMALIAQALKPLTDDQLINAAECCVINTSFLSYLGLMP